MHKKPKILLPKLSKQISITRESENEVLEIESWKNQQGEKSFIAEKASSLFQEKQPNKIFQKIFKNLRKAFSLTSVPWWVPPIYFYFIFRFFDWWLGE